MSQAKLAKILGIYQTEISSFEKGYRDPNEEIKEKIKLIFGDNIVIYKNKGQFKLKNYISNSDDKN
jgi:DNA-binding XRE family transcriptional regulator